MSSHRQGFSLIEVLIVVAVIGILASLVLAALTQSRNKAYDNSIRNDIGQLRWLAEEAYDSQAGSYQEWSQESAIVNQVTLLLEDIDKQYGDPAGEPYTTIIRQTQKQDYCVSTPLRAQVGKFYCIDKSGIFSTTTSACPDNDEYSAPLLCPTS